jgi:hypothetical protein
MLRRALPFVLGSVLTLAAAQPARALFHLAVIDEVMTSYGGDPSVQFVEIRMLSVAQNLVQNSVLGVFDTTGAYLGDVLVVPGNVLNSSSGARWIMGTTQFQVGSGLTADFTMPAGLPTAGGMVCWGAPGITVPPAPGSWDHTVPTNYIDCLAYGTYAGPTNPLIGTPTALDADGHSLERVTTTNNNVVDFVCADPASPENNNGASVSMPATTPCPGPPPGVPAASLSGILVMAALLGLSMFSTGWALRRRALRVHT